MFPLKYLFATFCLNNIFTTAENHGAINTTQLLFQASQEGNQDVLEWMLKQGADINAKDSLGRTLLAENIERDNSINMTKFLLNTGANIEEVDELGRSALLVAASFGKAEHFGLLLEKGADANAKDSRGRNAAHLAAGIGSSEVLKKLDTRLNGMINATDDYGRTPLWYAAAGGKLQVLNFLKVNGTEINQDILVAAVTGGNLDIVKTLFKDINDMNSKNQSGASVLQIACDKNRQSVAKYLIENGADLNTKDEEGRSLLHICSASGSDEVVSSLLEKGIDVETKDSQGNTALNYAVANDNQKVTSVLIKNGAKISARNNDGDSPAEYAIKNNALSSLPLLLSDGYDVNQTNPENMSLCHIASKSGSAMAVKFVLEQGVYCEGEDSHGNHPIHYAVDNEQVLKNLLEGRVNPNVEDREGNTPLQLAATIGNLKSASCLLKYGANSTNNIVFVDSPDDRYYAYVQNSPLFARIELKQLIENVNSGNVIASQLNC